MAYNKDLADRVRLILAVEPTTEVKMFGGLCFLVRGNMAGGIIGDELMVRTKKEEQPGLLALPHVREMDFTGRPSRGSVFVGPGGTADDDSLREWVGRGLELARGLAPKG